MTPDLVLDLQVELAAEQHPTQPLPEGTRVIEGGLVHVCATTDLLCIDRSIVPPKVKRSGFKSVMKEVVSKPPKAGAWRAYEIKFADIVSIEIEGLTTEHARGWNWTAGWVGSGKRVAGTTGVLITTRDGWIMLRHYGVPPLQVKAMWTPLIARVPPS